MKKLSKIKLQNAVKLENQEMKMIFGGSGGATCVSHCSPGGCSRNQICVIDHQSSPVGGPNKCYCTDKPK